MYTQHTRQLLPPHTAQEHPPYKYSPGPSQKLRIHTYVHTPSHLPCQPKYLSPQWRKPPLLSCFPPFPSPLRHTSMPLAECKSWSDEPWRKRNHACLDIPPYSLFFPLEKWISVTKENGGVQRRGGGKKWVGMERVRKKKSETKRDNDQRRKTPSSCLIQDAPFSNESIDSTNVSCHVRDYP